MKFNYKLYKYMLKFRETGKEKKVSRVEAEKKIARSDRWLVVEE